MSRFYTGCLAILFAVVVPLQAAFLENDGQRSSAGPAVERDALGERIRSVTIGHAYHHSQLVLYPLICARPASQDDIVTFDEARRRGWIVLQERDNATVGALDIINKGPRHVLLLSGAIVAGGKQNRMIREDVLLPPRRQPVPLPVYCIEQERWRGADVALRPTGALAHPRLRKAASAASAQDAIWGEVSGQSARAGVSSATRDYQALYNEPDLGRRLDEVAAGFRKLAPAQCVGVAAVSGQRIIAIDLFSDPRLFAASSDALLRGYAMQCLNDTTPKRRWLQTPAITAGDIQRCLDRALRARRTAQKTPGAGHALRLSGTLEGSALIWGQHLVHASFWPE